MCGISHEAIRLVWVNCFDIDRGAFLLLWALDDYVVCEVASIEQKGGCVVASEKKLQ